MATNRDLLKEALADAKAVKEMAIANAKAALEEAFTPQLQSMLSMKLQEMEDEDEMEDLDESGFGKGRAEGDVGFSSMGEKALDEEEDMDLDELLNELNEEEEEMESEEEEMETEEGEPLDLEDMTDEDLKKFIEDVISDMVSSGELEAGEEVEGEEGEEEGEEEEEVNLDELLAEIEGMDEEMEDESMMYEEEMEEESMMYEEEEDLDEAFGDMFKRAATKFIKANQAESDKIIAMDDKKAALEMASPLIMKFRKEQLEKGQTPDAIRSDVSDLRQQLKLSGLGGASKSSVSTAENLQKDLDEALATIKTLRGDLNEINLLNAKLLFTNKIFKAKNLTESQKVNVLTSFDKATTVKEVKLVFETLNEGLKTKNSKVNENYGSASKGTGTTKTKQPIVESNDMVSRFQKLAGII
jgi:hypothetical protein